MQNEHGQSLVEVIVVAAVAVIVVGALTFAVIASLRNASFSQNQTQATKLAQEGLEKVRSLRDRDLSISTDIEGVTKFSDFWSKFLSNQYCNTTTVSTEGPVSTDGPCYFSFINNTLTQVNKSNPEVIDNFGRLIQIFDRATCDDLAGNVCYQYRKEVTVTVSWRDFSGPHESKLTTILRKK